MMSLNNKMSIYKIIHTNTLREIEKRIKLVKYRSQKYLGNDVKILDVFE